MVGQGRVEQGLAGQVWIGLDTPGHVKAGLGRSEQVCSGLFRCAFVWIGQSTSGQVKTGLVEFEQVWTCLDRSGHVWTCLEMSGQVGTGLTWLGRSKKVWAGLCRS